MNHILHDIARHYVNPATALSLKTTCSTLNSLISKTTLLACFADYLYSKHGTDAIAELWSKPADAVAQFDALTDVLVLRGADIHAKHDWALIAAARAGSSVTVRRILDAGANAGAIRAALRRANKEDVIRLLMRDMSKLELERELIVASANGDEQIVRVLVDDGVDVNTRYGLAFSRAISRGHLETAEILLSGGPRVNGGLCREMRSALEMGRMRVVQLLLIHGPSALGCGFFRKAVLSGRDDVVRMMLESGANVGDYGDILNIAAGAGHINIVKSLLAAGVEVDDQALRAATENGNAQAVRLLLEHGGKVTRELVAFASAKGHTEVVATFSVFFKVGGDGNT
ncbi:hypothetical protein HK104_007857 [Borealophlyctis nickersoniae]|nr:hypothetical protein HK104_007857 [Borealophlyctis nickersoniae]